MKKKTLQDKQNLLIKKLKKSKKIWYKGYLHNILQIIPYSSEDLFLIIDDDEDKICINFNSDCCAIPNKTTDALMLRKQKLQADIANINCAMNSIWIKYFK